MTGSQIKAWRLKRKIGMREWCIMLRPLSLDGPQISYAETDRWPFNGGHSNLSVWHYRWKIEDFITGYEAAEKKLGSDKCAPPLV